MKAVPAIRGQMGSTTYYQTKLNARELVSTVRPAREMDNWASASIEERMQRDLNLKRIMDEIVPYLARHKDRLFGSLIILVPKDTLEFEPLTDVVGKVPGAYKSAVGAMGFLTVEKGEQVALDGQHRLIALREVITSADNLGEYQADVGSDEVSVIVVEFESNEKTRRIFNKVNRNAKPTGRSDNILLSEDDLYAIVTRMLLDQDRDAPLAAVEVDGKLQELVNWRSNTLARRVKELTTISAVYETAIAILSVNGFDPAEYDEKKRQVRPDQAEIDKAYDIVASWWTQMLDSLDAFREALADLNKVSDVRFAEEPPYHRHTLLLRPVGQIAMVLGVQAAINNSRDPKTKQPKLSLETALKRLNKLDWSVAQDSYWRDTIVRADGRMVARREAYNLAAQLIAYLIGNEYLDDEQRDALWEAWNDARHGKGWQAFGFNRGHVAFTLGRIEEHHEREETVIVPDGDLLPEELPDPVQ